PSWPARLPPQHQIAPSPLTTQLCESPSPGRPLDRTLTRTGNWLIVAISAPTMPLLLSPQHQTLPSVRRAQVCASPAASTSTPPRLLTRMGRRLVVPVVVSPSWPFTFSPQHSTEPSSCRAHE